MSMCFYCGESKSPTDFYKDPKKHTRCKECWRAYTRINNRKHYLKKKEKHNTRTKKWYQENKHKWKEYHANRIKNSDYKKKERARQQARRAVKKGIIKKENCSSCNSPISELHHENYSKPLEVIWLCRPCHGRKHVEQKPNRHQPYKPCPMCNGSGKILNKYSD